MLNQPYFYHGAIKNIITIFGAIFSDIYVKRHTGDGGEYQQIKIPLSYAPKQRALVRIAQNPNLDIRQAQITLPRMAFEIVSVNYDAARKISPNSISKNCSTASYMNGPTPYNINVNLYIYTKNQDDALQIVEQIFPFFNPDLNISINSIPEMNVKEDIPVILDSVSYEDDYEGDLETRRAIIWTLSFTIKMNFYGPIKSPNGIIKKVNINMSDTQPNDSGENSTFVKYTARVDPITAGPSDVHTIVEEFLY